MSSDPLSRACLISCVSVDHDLGLLPHFVEHYLRLGLASSRMHLILNTTRTATPRLGKAIDMLVSYGIAPAEVWIEPYTSDGMWAKRREVQRRLAAPDDWVISADVDELHEYPEALEDFLAFCDSRGINTVQGVFIDRLAVAGRLAPVTREARIWDQFPVQADVICSIGRQGRNHDWYGTVKLMAFKGRVLPSRGGHHPLPGQEGVSYLFGGPLAALPGIGRAGLRFGIPLRVHHFHWTAALPGSLRERLATPGVSAAGREYGAKLLDHFEENGEFALREVPTGDGTVWTHIPWRQRVAGLRAVNGLGDVIGRVRRLLRVRRPRRA